MPKLIICGDVLPTDINMKMFEDGSIENIISPEILKIIRQADYRVANLEGCFTDGNEPIIKTGPNLKASVKAFDGFKKIGFDMVGLANNHSMDYGVEGLTSTIDLLDKNCISWCGVGKTLSEAYREHIAEIGNKRVGFIALAESEFTIAQKNSPGAACFDDLDSPDFISSVKKNVDYLVVLYHGGKEYYRYPAPYVQKRCRKLVDKGANLVVTQHSHCVGCMEDYNSGTIVYGQGNFLLSRGPDNDYRKSGLILSVDLESGGLELNVVMRDGVGIRLANENEYQEVKDAFLKRSSDIKVEGFVDQNYRSFADSLFSTYQIQSLGKVAAYLEKVKALKFATKLYGADNMLAILNTLRCEAHRDVYIQGLINKLSEQMKE